MIINQLILLPAQHSDCPDNQVSLIEPLQALGFIGSPLQHKSQTHYRPGDRFLQLLTFLGCSPVVALGEPGLTGDEFCHIQLDGPYAEAKSLAGDNLKAARCPACNQSITNTAKLIIQWPAKQDWHCPKCGKTSAITSLRWRQSAGFGRYFLRVWGVFEGESVPGDELLTTLHKSCGYDWQYFYYRVHEK
ncbi:MAG: hypothetical protein WCX90_07570 [Thiohalomonadaceae bacterium]